MLNYGSLRFLPAGDSNQNYEEHFRRLTSSKNTADLASSLFVVSGDYLLLGSEELSLRVL